MVAAGRAKARPATGSGPDLDYRDSQVRNRAK